MTALRLVEGPVDQPWQPTRRDLMAREVRFYARWGLDILNAQTLGRLGVRLVREKSYDANLKGAFDMGLYAGSRGFVLSETTETAHRGPREHLHLV